jgi:hypothetical protein
MSKKNVLIIYHSNAGQTRHAIDLLSKGLVAASDDIQIHRAKIVSDIEQPFPWPFLHFFSIFPDCIKGRSCPIKLEWEQEKNESIDLIVYASPVWFLSPSLPSHGFFQSEASKILNGKPVLTLMTSRNMWYSAMLEVRGLISQAGGRVIDSIVLMDRAAPWTTFVTTPVWMLTGKKKISGFPEAGIQSEDFAQLLSFGKILAQQKDQWLTGKCFLEGQDSVALAEKYILPEIVIKNLLFKPWASLIYLMEPLGGGFKKILVSCFVLSLIFSILILIPFVLILKVLLKIF